MSELRDLLDREARRVHGDRDALTAVMRRLERRRRTRRVTRGALAPDDRRSGLGAYRAFRPADEAQLGQGGPPEVFEGIWPETGRQELSIAQQSIDEGHQPWRTDPVETARAFATNVLHWNHDRVEAETIEYQDHPSTVVVRILNRDFPNVDADLATLVGLRQLGREGEAGIWSVVSADSRDQVSAESSLLLLSSPELGELHVPGAPLQLSGVVSYAPRGSMVEAATFPGEGEVPFVGECSLVTRRFEIRKNAFSGDIGPVPDDPDGSLILVARVIDPEGTILGAAAMHVTIAVPGDTLPPAVAAKRDAIAEAAAERNYEALRLLINPDNFTFSYGGGRDPVKFWRDLEKLGEDPLHTLQVLMTMPFALDESGIYVWPSFFISDPTKLTDQELRLARTFATQEEIDSWRQFGLYFGYRVGIEPDGDWIFFVAGD